MRDFTFSDGEDMVEGGRLELEMALGSVGERVSLRILDGGSRVRFRLIVSIWSVMIRRREVFSSAFKYKFGI